MTLTSATYNGNEGDTTFQGVCVQADEAGGGTTLRVDFDVTLVTTPTTASESFYEQVEIWLSPFYTGNPDDFTVSVSVVSFLATENSGLIKCFGISLDEDFNLEGDEMFTVAITASAGADLGATTVATVIQDNDGE